MLSKEKLLELIKNIADGSIYKDAPLDAKKKIIYLEAYLKGVLDTIDN